MPLRAAHVGRVGVVGAPVARTAVVAAAVTPWPVACCKDCGGGRGGDAGARASSENLKATTGFILAG